MKLTTLVKDLAEKLLPIYEHPATATDNAWWIITALTGLSKTAILARKDSVLTDEQQKTLAIWLDHLLHKKMPLQYLIGSVPFLYLEIYIRPPTLIPRPETEMWVADLIEEYQQQPPRMILDLCTGSGCIALALAKAFPASTVLGVDRQEHALKLAQENALKNMLNNIEFIKSDLFEQVPQRSYDLIVSNPPYISQEEWKELDPTVQLWEDRVALVAEDNGTALIKKIIDTARTFLVPGGSLFIEIGYKQGQEIAQWYQKSGFNDVRILKDIHGQERVVTGIWKTD